MLAGRMRAYVSGADGSGCAGAPGVDVLGCAGVSAVSRSSVSVVLRGSGALWGALWACMSVFCGEVMSNHVYFLVLMKMFRI